jgi:hypothetical protein
MSNESDEEFNNRYKAILINMDEEVGPYHSQGGADHEADKAAFTIGMKLTSTAGKEESYTISLEDPDDEAYFLNESTDEKSFPGTLRWLNVLNLAGALTFSDPEESLIFIDPLASWAHLYFKQLPLVAAHAELGQFVWRRYSSIEVWLKDETTGEFLSKLRLVDPGTDDSD